PQEEVVEASVLEVVLDARATDPPDASVYHDELAMVDVAEPVEVPARGRAGRDGPHRSAQLNGPDDADIDAAGQEPVVESLALPVRIGSLAVDDEANGHALGCLCEQH